MGVQPWQNIYNITCRFQYSVSRNVRRIKLATNTKTTKIHQGRLYIQSHEQTPQYITDLLKQVSETHNHIGEVAIEYVNIIDESKSKIVQTEFLIANWRQIEIKTLFLDIFDSRSSIENGVFDCRLPGVIIVH